MRRAALILLLAAWVPLCGASYTAHREVEAGNAALAAGDPKAAIGHYEEAGRTDPKEPAIPYNLGTARLADGDLDGAVEALGSAAGEPGAAPPAAADPVRARAAFNLGNAHLERAQGENARADLQAAVRAFRQAVAADPEDTAARRNLQIAATRLRDLPPPQEQQRQQSPQNQSQQGGQQQPSQADDSEGEPRQGPKPQDAGKPSQDEKEASPAPSAQGSNTPDDKAQAKGQTGGSGDDARKGDLPEDVTRALAALRRKEAAVMREALRRGMGKPEQVEPDW